MLLMIVIRFDLKSTNSKMQEVILPLTTLARLAFILLSLPTSNFIVECGFSIMNVVKYGIALPICMF